MLCSWIAVVTLIALSLFFILTEHTSVKTSTVQVVISTLHSLFLLFTAAVNIYMFKKHRKRAGLADSQKSTRQLPQAAHHQKSMHLKHKASILVLLLAVIMIVTCLPNSLVRMIRSICYVYKLHCNLQFNSTIIVVISILQDLNFLVNPLVYIWNDRIYRNAFYPTFKIVTAQL